MRIRKWEGGRLGRWEVGKDEKEGGREKEREGRRDGGGKGGGKVENRDGMDGKRGEVRW